MTDSLRDRYFEYSQRFWNLANYLVGFAATQTLAFLYALGSDDFVDKIDHVPEWIIGAVVASTLFSEFLLHHCCRQEKCLLADPDDPTSHPAGLLNAVQVAYTGRAIVLVLIGVLGIAGYVAALPADPPTDAGRPDTVTSPVQLQPLSPGQVPG